ncbi:hypothetical protein N7U66_00740 [Lacinutrix neustonica]|uniref:Cardiolipin synthetase n=1 Tax=Lacinutrix neustonica TaxID=2980107 RepID=A0A9E8MWP3_9FLAO|nr:hypothetical protein [Lacinutrix neustonica]WAC02320.1 hypothetical protein N7U66_00740 [Lacinutrix neustonica]
MKPTALLMCFLLVLSCTSTDLVENWKNPDMDSYTANKILIVGMTQNTHARKQFEKLLKLEYASRGVEAVMSVELFDAAFTTKKKSVEELKTIENKLIRDGFDTILLTKVIGVEDKRIYREAFVDYHTSLKTFKEDYLKHQDIFYNPDYYYQYSVYHTVSSLYCICPTKDRELIRKGYIDITDPNSMREIVKDYVRLITVVLEEQQLINPKIEPTTKEDSNEIL